MKKKRNRPKLTKDNKMLTDKNMTYTLQQIDKEIVSFIYSIINDVTSSEGFYLKTDFSFMSYNIYLYFKGTNCIVGKTWPIIDFLKLGSEKKLEYEINIVVRDMIVKAKDKRNTSKSPDLKDVLWI